MTQALNGKTATTIAQRMVEEMEAMGVIPPSADVLAAALGRALARDAQPTCAATPFDQQDPVTLMG